VAELVRHRREQQRPVRPPPRRHGRP
jgi:hypothetical protein